MTNQPRTMAEFAAAENAAARVNWDYTLKGSMGLKKDVAERLQPFLGSGMTQVEVAAQIGCTSVAVGKTLRKMGWTL